VLELLPRPSIMGIFVNDVRSSGGAGSYTYYQEQEKRAEFAETTAESQSEET